MPKIHRTKPINGRPNLMSATDDEHARQRRLLAHAFSEQALRDQEPLMISYIDLLIRKLKSRIASGSPIVDMQEWLTFTTFDIISDLSFGKPFGNLEHGRPIGWVATFKHAIKQGVLFTAFRSMFPEALDGPSQRQIGPYVQAKRHEQGRYAAEAIKERLERQTDRPDFVSYCLRNQDDERPPDAELASMFTIVALAGCESPATALSGAVFHLLRNPAQYQRLKDEIRSIASESDIDSISTSNMPYLKAVMDESMRIYPPVPAAMDRVVPGPGAKVSPLVSLSTPTKACTDTLIRFVLKTTDSWSLGAYRHSGGHSPVCR